MFFDHPERLVCVSFAALFISFVCGVTPAILGERAVKAIGQGYFIFQCLPLTVRRVYSIILFLSFNKKV